MSAIQEALERVRKERENSRQDDLSWVKATVRLGPCERPHGARFSLRLGLLVLAGAAIGVIASQVSFTQLQQGAGVLRSRSQETHTGFPHSSSEISGQRELLEAGAKGVSRSQEPLQAPSGKDAVGFSPALRDAMASAKRMKQEGDLKGAERELLGFLEKEPNSVEGLVALAELYVQHLSQADKAIALYQRAMQESAKRAPLLVNLGVAYMKSGDPAKAAETILSALEIDPWLVEAHYNMACALALQGKKLQAAGFLEKAALLDSRVCQWAMEDPDLLSLRDVFPGNFQVP